MSTRYIGSKARIAEAIGDIIGAPTPEGRLIDAFAGTGSVASVAADNGWRVDINDSLVSATVVAKARLTASADVPFESFGGYEACLQVLHSLPLEPGFVTKAYSPASSSHGPTVRQYFTVANAHKIDTWRYAIRRWLHSGDLTKSEHDLLLAGILNAANSAANTAGTYGSYLKHWSPGALRAIAVKKVGLRANHVDFRATVGLAESLKPDSADTVYLDPPYTKRQYAAYYHVLETIALGDEPDLSGSTGLRPWKHLASRFSYRSKALDAIVELVDSYDARRVLLSYSDQGHADLGELAARLSETRVISVLELGPLGRYTPNIKAAANGSRVREFIIECVKEPANAGALERG